MDTKQVEITIKMDIMGPELDRFIHLFKQSLENSLDLELKSIIKSKEELKALGYEINNIHLDFKIS